MKIIIILCFFLNCTFIHAQNDTISRIISAYDKWDDELCNNLIEKFSNKNVIIVTEQDSINYNIYNCIKGYQMPQEKLRSIDYSSQYYKSIKYLYKKKLGDYLTSFVNDLYNKSDLFTPNSSLTYKSNILSLLEESLNYSIKDLNYDRLFTKIERFYTLKNISYLFENIHPDKTEEILIKINLTLQFYNDNNSFFESKDFNSSKLYYFLKFKTELLSKTNNKKEEIETKQNIIEILYHYKKEVDINYIESIELYYNSLNFDSFKTGDFKSLLYLINKYNTDIPDFELIEVKEILESISISQKQKTIERITSDLENNKVPVFKQKAFCHLIYYLIYP